MRPVIAILLVLVAEYSALAQVTSRPTDPPLVTAANESWYQLREPIQLAGDVYYPAGAAQFFNGNTMVRAGHYNGVPIYADATVEPFSIVLVPISRGLLQPYERRRRGDLAGTTGSRAPSFPVQVTPRGTSLPRAAVSPTALPLPAGAIGVFTPERADREGPPRTADAVPRAAGAAPPVADAARTFMVREPAGVLRETVGTGGVVATPGAPVVTLLRPENNDGVWIRYQGAKYISAGEAIPFDSAAFRHVGDHGTFPVFARGADPNVIYLPTSRAGVVAPYRLKR